MKSCPHCGKALPQEMQFCPYCMEKLITETVIIDTPIRRRRRWWLWMILVFLLLLLLLGGGWWLKQRYPSPIPTKEDAVASTSHPATTTTAVRTTPSTTAMTTLSTSHRTTTTTVATKSTAIHTSVPSTSTSTTIRTSAPSTSTSTTIRTSVPSTTKSTTIRTSVPSTSTSTTIRTSAPSTSTSTTIRTTAHTTTAPCAAGHDWEDITQTVHVDEVGHYETKTVEKRLTLFRCALCYKEFGVLEDYYAHFDNQHDSDSLEIVFRDRYETFAEYREVEEQAWVVDTPAHDKTITVGRRCRTCDKTETNQDKE